MVIVFLIFVPQVRNDPKRNVIIGIQISREDTYYVDIQVFFDHINSKVLIPKLSNIFG